MSKSDASTRVNGSAFEDIFAAAVADEQTREVDARPSRRQAAIIGFDYGTHSTPVVYRRQGDDVAKVVMMEDQADGYPGFASPSLVSIKQGRVFFGARCLHEEGGTIAAGGMNGGRRWLGGEAPAAG